MNLTFSHRRIGCPTTERVGDCPLVLPFYNDLSEPEQAEVVDAVRQFGCRDAVGR
jgi:dTDP-4-amino-4,6-dideoxygalactose transaminase